MTVEQLLIAGIGAMTTALLAVVSALVRVCYLLWKKSERCDRDRVELRRLLEDVRQSYGEANGALGMFQKCSLKDCPFRGPARYHQKIPIGDEPHA